MRLPSAEYIEANIYEKYAVPTTIQGHCEKVRDVGTTLAKGLQNDGVQISPLMVDRLSLVHDAMKVVSLPTLVTNPDFRYVPSARELEAQTQLKERYLGMHETLIIADILRTDFPEFSEVVANIGSTGNPTYLNGSIELKVAHYADWRVQYTDIVPFSDRLDYLKRTYLTKQPEKGDAWWEEAVQKELALEREIFSHLPYKPEDLASIVGKA